ncbi:hypothetical protein ART_1247 [Arthrobacter sp. PAMC 25486]|uniref:hypothetical protein n=1 Tax=Arthrobacter sp. PAMC 25486 TaxID=1494608 RepID=UPI000535EE91|nr:hypothetical protein [Arthrobacter sp. PAMC 25486]AIY00846.1 hypothetical protein ART_1247 [Arthrobacter sp. PAMC 25486]
MTPDSNMPTPEDDPNDTGQGRRLKRKRPNIKRRKRVVAAGVSGSVLAIAVVSLVVAGFPLLNNAGGTPVVVKTTPPPIVVTTPAAPETFPAFERQDYVQPEVPETATEQVAPTTVTVGAETTGEIMPQGLSGLSLDTDHMVDVQMNPDLSNLAERLKMAGSPVLRFGGQAADRRFFWTSTDEPIPNWVVAPAYPTDTRPIIKVTPDVLRNVNRLLEAGDARILLTADMGHVDAARTADYAKYADEIFGDRLVGMSFGNEPNGWGPTPNPYYELRSDPSWSFEHYIAEAMPVAQAVVDAVPNVKIVGPDVYTEGWWKDYVAAGVPNLAALTFHNYPLSVCAPETPDDPQSRSISNMLSRHTNEASRAYAEAAVAVADTAGLQTWNTETNASSCGGSSATTKNHASGLWTLNYALTQASAGVSLLNFHGGLEACKGGAPMGPLCDTGTVRQPSGDMAMRPGFYGMMMTNKLGSGDFLRAESAGSENIYAYPVKHADGTMSVMVVNQNDPMAQAPAEITLTLPTQAATGTMTQMSGASFESEDTTRIDGLETNGEPLETQGKIPGFNAGDQKFTIALNSGTATILNFTF